MSRGVDRIWQGYVDGYNGRPCLLLSPRYMRGYKRGIEMANLVASSKDR